MQQMRGVHAACSRPVRRDTDKSVRQLRREGGGSVRYISLFSGIEAATVAWEPLGLEPVAFSEIDAFPSEVLAHHFPEVPNLGDITKIDWSIYSGAVDIIVGGSPCFVAGTLVLTETGYRPIETVKVGDLIVTHKGRLRQVSEIGSSVSDTLMLKGQGSIGIECTGNHPFMAIEKTRRWNNDKRKYELSIGSPEWTNAEDMEGRFWLNIGEFEPMDIPLFDGFSKGERGKGYIEDFEFSEGFFYFVGRWLGDGWANVHKRKERVDSQMKRVYLCCSHAEGDELQHRLESIGLHFSRGTERTTERFTFSSTQLFDWITGNFGVHATGKNMPAWCFGMKREYRQSLLDGYLDADGTSFENGYKSSTIDRALALGMKTLAATLGITTSVVRTENHRTCVIEGREVNEHANYCQTYYRSTRSPFFSDGGWYGKVRSVSSCRNNQIVYNLEVEDDHTYTADGIVCHNCQSFSVAGKREGLSGESGLMFEYIRAVSEIRPRYFVWENVPGALSSEGGAAFGQLLREMDDLGYGLAWRVLDAQFFGVAQRRRRVFLVGCLGDARRAAEILFERESLRWDYPSSKDKRKELAATALRCSDSGSYCIQGDIARGAHLGQNGVGYSDDGVSYTLNTMDVPAVLAFDTTQITSPTNGNNPQYGDPCHPLCANAHVPTIAFKYHQGSKAGGIGATEDGLSPTRLADNHPPAIAFSHVPAVLTNYGYEIAGTLTARFDSSPCIDRGQNLVCMATSAANAEHMENCCTTQTARQFKDAPIVSDGMIVRRLMPIECERLQGFHDNWTRIPYKGKPAEECPDTPRYKALGNSMAMPVMRWIGERIMLAEEVSQDA